VAFQLHDTEQVTLVVEALDAEGNEAAATTTWESSDETVASIRDTGGGSATVTASPWSGWPRHRDDQRRSSRTRATATRTSAPSTSRLWPSDAVTVNIIPGEVMPKDQPAEPPRDR
jgi:hypothetical protein